MVHLLFRLLHCRFKLLFFFLFLLLINYWFLFCVLATKMDHAQHHHMMDSTTSSPMNAHMGGMENHHMDDHHSANTEGSMDHSGGSMHMGHMMMKMYFHFGVGDTVLFDFWKVTNYSGLLSSMLGIFIAAMLYEGLKYFREYLYWKNYNMLQYQNVNKPTNQETERVINNLVNDVIHRQPPSLLSVHHVIQTMLHIIQITVSYLLMLIFMTYNVWLCLAVVLGSATGYFLFGWRKSLFVDVTEHCH